MILIKNARVIDPASGVDKVMDVADIVRLIDSFEVDRKRKAA